jgi:hypothetical protein
MVTNKEAGMNTIGDLRKALGLGTDNQVRNRIEAIKDLLYPYLRRGPNNQILVADPGVSLLRELQDLYDSGLTITQASSILATKRDYKDSIAPVVSDGFVTNASKHDETGRIIQLLQEEIAFLRERVKYLEQQNYSATADKQASAWWERIREEVDGA